MRRPLPHRRAAATFAAVAEAALIAASVLLAGLLLRDYTVGKGIAPSQHATVAAAYVTEDDAALDCDLDPIACEMRAADVARPAPTPRRKRHRRKQQTGTMSHAAADGKHEGQPRSCRRGGDGGGNFPAPGRP